MQWFDIDKQGLARLLERKGKSFAVFELVQNAWDENTTVVDVTLTRPANSAYVTLSVEDDNPEGFSDLSHAFTLFAESKKKSDAEKRGRFNLGEKLVLALCREATIASTSGTIVFDKEGRHTKRAARNAGSLFTGNLRMTHDEVMECAESVKRLLPPSGIVTRYNGMEIPVRKAIASFDISLPTEVADGEGVLRRSTRKTTVRVFEPLGNETPMLYEMGIPVVETGDRWHVDIGQKVPLNFDRDNVPPAYLSRVRAATLEAMSQSLSTEDANSTWVRDAMQNHGASMAGSTIDRVVELRFGSKRVSFDPSDPEANKLAVSKGYTVVHGSQLAKSEWEAVRRVGAIQPAGQVTPSPKPYNFGPGGKLIDYVDPENWSDGMRMVVAYTKRLAQHGIGHVVHVDIVNEPRANFIACYGSRVLQFNLGRLGHKWFEQPDKKAVTELVIHELGHEYSGDHLSSAYHDALCEIGSRLLDAALVHPQDFKL